VFLVLTDGRHATAMFNTNQPGGSLKILDAQLQTVFDGPLGGAVEEIPVFAQ
jgi:hypothetical protein